MADASAYSGDAADAAPESASRQRRSHGAACTADAACVRHSRRRARAAAADAWIARTCAAKSAPSTVRACDAAHARSSAGSLSSSGT
eukprot:96778-Chlamydomonas_euryale.AAC.1